MKTAKEWAAQHHVGDLELWPHTEEMAQWIADIQRDMLEHLKPHLDTPLCFRDKLYNEVLQQIEKGKE